MLPEEAKDLLLRSMAQAASRTNSFDIITDVLFAEIDEPVAEQIADFLARECSIEESSQVIQRAYSLLPSLCKSSFRSEATTRRTHSPSFSENQVHSGEHLASTFPIGAASKSAFSRGQNIHRNSKEKMESLSRQIITLLTESRLTYFQAVGTLIYALYIIKKGALELSGL